MQAYSDNISKNTTTWAKMATDSDPLSRLTIAGKDFAPNIFRTNTLLLPPALWLPSGAAAAAPALALPSGWTPLASISPKSSYIGDVYGF